MKKWLLIIAVVLALFWVMKDPGGAGARVRAGVGGLGEAANQTVIFIENATKGPQPGDQH